MNIMKERLRFEYGDSHGTSGYQSCNDRVHKSGRFGGYMMGTASGHGLSCCRGDGDGKPTGIPYRKDNGIISNADGYVGMGTACGEGWINGRGNG